MMTRIGAIKLFQADVKFWVAIGGWALNDPGPTQTTSSDMAASDVHIETFSRSLTRMMSTPRANSHANLTEIQVALDLLWRNKMDSDKVTVGMAYYSRSFTLADPGCHAPGRGCRVNFAGNPGQCSGVTGVLCEATASQ
ncbi:hypothetical protein EsHS_00004646 [Epichloe bromicola]